MTGTDQKERLLFVRSDTRRKVSATAVCKISSRPSTVVEVSDLSERGCQVSLRHNWLTPGDLVAIRIADLEVLSGVVRWTKGRIAGIRFDTPIYGPIVDHFAAMAKEIAPVVERPASPPLARPRWPRRFAC